MNDQITTIDAVRKRQTDSAFSVIPLVAPLPADATLASRAIDVLSFLFLIVFQCGAVIGLVLYKPQVGQMGLVVFGIIFIWLGATLIVGICDLWADSTRHSCSAGGTASEPRTQEAVRNKRLLRARL